MLLLVSPITLLAADVTFKRRSAEELAGQVPKLLASQDKATGRFGQGIWIVTDQNAMLALAAAWSIEDPKNPYHHSRELLDAVMAAGDALIADQDAAGKWEFRKKDGSTWGKIYMPWTYSRWIRSYLLVRDAMPEDRRARWAGALRLGYEGVSKELQKARPTNIPAHQAMGLYFAGQAFEKPEWRAQASEFMKKVVAAQNPGGYWTENNGPVVLYGAVYIDALATYAAASGDESVVPALRKAAQFFTYFTYPDGSAVETVDERNPYHARPAGPNVGLTYTPEGRTLLTRLLKANKALGSDLAAILLLYGKEGPGLDRDPTGADFDYVLGEGEAAVRRRGPWYVVASALTSPVSKNRWFMDRQNLVSVYHDRAGLILGGGNSKLQPEWSTFTIGDARSFHYQPPAGDSNPDFNPPPGLRHIPTAARLVTGKSFGLNLEYGSQRLAVRLNPVSPDRLECVWSAVDVSEGPAVARATIIPRIGRPILSASGKKEDLGDNAFEWPRGAAGAWIEHAGFRVMLPKSASVLWPAIPWDPYVKDGRGKTEMGLIVIRLPITRRERITIQVPSTEPRP